MSRIIIYLFIKCVHFYKYNALGFGKGAQNLVGVAIGCIWTGAGLSIVGLIAYGIDCVDSHKHNGYCFG